MTEQRVIEILLFLSGVAFFLLSSFAFFVALQIWNPVPLLAGIAAAFVSYLAFRGAQFEHRGW